MWSGVVAGVLSWLAQSPGRRSLAKSVLVAFVVAWLAPIVLMMFAVRRKVDAAGDAVGRVADTTKAAVKVGVGTAPFLAGGTLGQTVLGAAIKLGGVLRGSQGQGPGAPAMGGLEVPIWNELGNARDRDKSSSARNNTGITGGVRWYDPTRKG